MKKSIILALLTCCTSFSTTIFAVELTGDATFQDLLKQFPLFDFRRGIETRIVGSLWD
ncbi:MAG: hypothetical protein RIS64_1880 [Bacteroidota bacterium]|jgi:hypothetical protein